MKFFALCLVFLVAGAYAVELTEPQKAIVRAVVNYCTKEAGTTLEIVKQMHLGHWDNVDDKAKCFFGCSVRVNGVITDGSTINESAVRSRFTPVFGTKIVEDAITACGGTTGKDICEQGFNLFKCFYNHGIRVPLDK